MINEVGRRKSDSMVGRHVHLAPEHLARHAAVIDDLLRPEGGRKPVVVAQMPKLN